MVTPAATILNEVIMQATDVTLDGFTFDVCYANFPVTAKVFINTTEMTGASLFATFTPTLASGTGVLTFHFSNSTTYFDAGGTQAVEIKFSGLNIGTTEIPISTFNVIFLKYKMMIEKYEISENNTATEYIRNENLDFYVYFNFTGKLLPSLYVAQVTLKDEVTNTNFNLTANGTASPLVITYNFTKVQNYTLISV